MSAQQLVQAVQAAASVTATAEERKQAIAAVEHAKAGDAQTCIQAFFLLFQAADASAQLNGLTLLRHVLRNHWEGLQAEQQQQLLQFITAATVEPNVSNRAQPIRMQLAYATSDLLILSGEQATEQLLSTGIVQMLQQDAATAVIGSKVVQFLSEEVAETPLSKRNGSVVFAGGSEAAARRRSLLSTLQSCSSPLLSLLIAAASAYMQSSISNSSQGQTSEAEKNQTAVRASLEALAALSTWLPLKTLKESQLLDMCSSLLQSPPLQSHAIEVLTQISNRSSKQASRDGEDYTTLFTQVASILVAAVPLIAPTDTPLNRLLESDETADAACRICSAISDFVTCGHLQSVPRELQLQVLLQLAGYLGSSYLPLSSLTFAAWRRLVQGHERYVNKSPGTNSVVELPPECLQIVLQHSVRVLDIVIIVAAPGAEEEFPDYVDSLSEWREMCGLCKSAVKYILGEVLAFTLDAVMGPMCAFQLTADSSKALSSLCEHLAAFQPSHVALVPRVGKILESLGPVLLVEPAQAQRVVEAFFALIDRMHALQGGVAQGQNEAAPHTKEQRSLTKCYFTLASKAPSALVPFLEAIAQRTISLVDSNVLGYADKNVICEGLLLSAARDGPDLFGRVVAALVAPIRGPWEKLIEELPNAEALIDRMLTPITEGPNGMAHIGSNDARSFVYYSLQLLLFCARQAKSCEGKGGFQVIHAHMEWMLLSAVRLLQCLMGLARPEFRNGGPLAAVRGILDISPLERASCMNQQAFLEAKTRTEELEPGRMDPTSVHGVRGWIRQCKELAMMLVNECASGVPGFWDNARLCAVLPEGIMECLEHQEPRAMRLVVHHAFIPLVRSCPPAAAPRWLAPALRRILPIVQTQLQNMWVERAARAETYNQGREGTKTEDDIVQEVLLRELSRDMMEAIRALFGSTSFPSIPPGMMGKVITNPNAFGTIQRLRAANARATNEGNAAEGTEKQASSTYNMVPWDQTVAHALMVGNHEHILAAASLAATAMRWPDQNTQLRAVSVCRTIAAAAGAPLNPVASNPGVLQPHAAPLQQLLVPLILPEAMMALASADGGNVVTELLLLIRSVYVAYAAATPSPGSKIQALMPSVSTAALDQLNAELQSNKTEKHHKDVLKRFFVAAGFVNLEKLNEQRVSTAAVGHFTRTDASMATTLTEDYIQWPDLYDVNIE